MNLTSARWRKSSRSTNNGGACVEVATVSLTGCPSASNGGNPELPANDRVMAVRDSKHPDGPSLAFTTGQWATFTAGVKSDLFNL